MKKNRGFTLIELLSVILILAIVFSIAFQIVTSRIEKSKEKLYNVQVNNIIEASKKYMLENSNLDKNHVNTLCVELTELQEKGYLEKGKIENPKVDNEDMTKTHVVKIKFDEENNQYDYKLTEICTAVTKVPIGETIINSVNIEVVRNNAGLYETNDAYIYRGMNPNNYINFNGTAWRIVSIDKETMMVKIVNLNGDSYNWQENGIIDNVNDEFTTGSKYDNVRDYISINSKWEKNNIDTLESALTVKSIEKQIKSYSTIGLLTVGDIIDASLDSECYIDNSCNSYLNTGKKYMLFNKTSTGSSWYLENGKILNKVATNNDQFYGYPVLYLKLSTPITGGNGTLETPYIIANN